MDIMVILILILIPFYIMEYSFDKRIDEELDKKSKEIEKNIKDIEKLLDKINPKNYEKLKFYKHGYIRLNDENKQLKEQQKEFIDYLEKEIVDSRAGSSQYYSAIQHLKLFKEIIGSDK